MIEQAEHVDAVLHVFNINSASPGEVLVELPARNFGQQVFDVLNSSIRLALLTNGLTWTIQDQCPSNLGT